MLLLVSVRSASEAAAALAGGADIIDAKEPLAGALGPVPIDTLREIRATTGDACPLSAALGDASTNAAAERDARAYADAGAIFVKMGFAGTSCAQRIGSLIDAAVRGVPARVIAVAYADYEHAATVAPHTIIDAAARAGAAGVLLDTADKRLPGLRVLISQPALAAWVAAAHRAGLMAAVAGKLTAEDLPFARDTGADIAGVRGAACDGGRSGVISAAKVRSCVRSSYNPRLKGRPQ